MIAKQRKLLTKRNILGETPLFRAVRFGKIKMFKLLAHEVDKDNQEVRKEQLQSKDGTSILHIAVITEHFGEFLCSFFPRPSCPPSLFHSINLFLYMYICYCEPRTLKGTPCCIWLPRKEKALKRKLPKVLHSNCKSSCSFLRLKELVKSDFVRLFNHKNQTAEELLVDNYSKLHEESKEWTKRTSENCSIVGVLIATVAFAAAYTVPGGNQSTGIPKTSSTLLFKS
ncbi:unnamed protein product, partial [Vitis vinifera]